MAAVAICIVTFNSEADLPDCLAAVQAQEHHPLEVVVVDCASSDRTVEIARQHPLPGRVQVIGLSENLGFAGGMNVAIGSCEAPFVLSLNPDARPAPDYVQRLLARCEDSSANERIGAVTGRLMRQEGVDGAILDAAGMHMTLTWRHLDRGSSQPDRGQYRVAERVFGATGAASLFLREALVDVSIDGEVFASEFHSYREDAELAFRLQERGWTVLYEPEAVASHERTNLPGRRRQMTSAVNYHSLKNRYLLRAYHQNLVNLLLTGVPTLFRDLGILGYALLRERSSLAAYGWLWRHRGRILRQRRQIQQRRSVPARRVDQWFLRRSLPL